tara:strand:+ start:3051 stop:3557 length:507 start_codon:yes stop_codon:yes gene_type:complete
MNWMHEISKAGRQPSGTKIFEKKFITSGIEASSRSIDTTATVEWRVEIYEQSATPTGNIFTDPRGGERAYQQSKGIETTGGTSEWISGMKVLVDTVTINWKGRPYTWNGNEIAFGDGIPIKSFNFYAGPAASGYGGIAPAIVRFAGTPDEAEKVSVQFNPFDQLIGGR